MKFRACVSDPVCFKHLLDVINTVSRLAKVCTLRLTPTHVYFIVLDASSLNSTPALWCELRQTSLFAEYRLAGYSDEFDEIYVEVRPDGLARSLSTCAKNAAARSSVKLKLTRRQSACLTISIDYLPSAAASVGGDGTLRRIVTHDVPVVVLSQRVSATITEPRMPRFHVSIELPCLRTMRSVVERMKKLGDRITVAASNDGRFILRVRSQLASAATHFDSQRTFSRLCQADDSTSAEKDEQFVQSDRGSDDQEVYEVLVDAKPLAMFLTGEQLRPNRAVCNVVHGRMLHMFLILDDIVLQYYIPGVEVD